MIAFVTILSFSTCFQVPTIPQSPHETGSDGTNQLVDQLIRQLGSAWFDEREAAMLKLMQIQQARPGLRKAANSGDAEVARRARKLLDYWHAKCDLVQLREFTSRGEVDLAIEKFVQPQDWHDDMKVWQVMAQLAGTLCTLEKEQFGKASLPDDALVPARDFRRFAEVEDPPIRFVSRGNPSSKKLGYHVAARAQRIMEATDAVSCFYVVAGEVVILNASRTVVLAGSSVKLNTARRSLVVSDGDVTIAGGLLVGCLIIAGGDVYCREGQIEDCRIVCSGRARIMEGAQVSQNSKIKDQNDKPLGFVKFVDPAEIGLETETGSLGLAIRAAAKDKPFGKAGLQSGDIIISVDGQETGDTRRFRRVLRPKIAEHEEISFRVRRGKETLEIKVQIPEPENNTRPVEKRRSR